MVISERTKQIYIEMYLKRVARYERNGLSVPTIYTIAKQLNIYYGTLINLLDQAGIKYIKYGRGAKKQTSIIEIDI